MAYEDLNLGGSSNTSDKTIIVGNEVVPPSQVHCDKDYLVKFDGTDYSAFTLTEEQLSRGTMLIGSTGCGKTTTFYQILDQLIPKLTNDDVMFIFDPKGDFKKRYFDQNNPCHILISANIDDEVVTKSWNIFGELIDKFFRVGTYTDIMAMEISKSLFKGLKSDNQPFFSIAATDIFSMVIACLCRDAARDHKLGYLNNQILVDRLKKFKAEDYYRFTEKYPQYGYIKSYLGKPDAPNNQALGVMGVLNAMVSSQFIGPFRKNYPAGQFSIKRIMRERGKKIIFLEYDVSIGETLSPIYSLFLDMAIKEALSVGKGSTYFICDEINLMPQSDALEQAVNFGRGRGLKTVIGLQCISQLYDNYGENKAKSIAAGFLSAFCFNCVDYDTRKYVSERFGTTFENYSFAGNNIQREGYTVCDSDIHNLEPGQAFIDLYKCSSPFKFKFKR